MLGPAHNPIIQFVFGQKLGLPIGVFNQLVMKYIVVILTVIEPLVFGLGFSDHRTDRFRDFPLGDGNTVAAVPRSASRRLC
jgi:hypothetical protein